MTTDRPEQQFEPDQSSLRRQPDRCPHCGRALPGEPELRAPDDRVYDPSRPRARYSTQRKRVEIFGGDSGFSEADPFSIDADRVDTTADVARWMARLAAKPWSRGEEFLQTLGEALCAARRGAITAGGPRQTPPGPGGRAIDAESGKELQ